MFEFKPSDLYKCKRKSLFFGNNRSLVCVDELSLEIQRHQSKTTLLKCSLHNLNYYLLHLNDFNYSSFPVLLLDPLRFLPDYYDGYVQSLGFVSILGVNRFSFSLSLGEVKQVQLNIDDITLTFCHDSLKKLSHHLDFLKLT